MSTVYADYRNRKTWKNIIKIYLIVRYTLLAEVICKTSFREHNSLWQVRVECGLARAHEHTHTQSPAHEHTYTILDIAIIVKYFVSDNRLAAPQTRRRGEGAALDGGEVSKSVSGYFFFCETARCRGSSHHNVYFWQILGRENKNFSRKIDCSSYCSQCVHQIYIRIRTIHRLM